MRDLQADLHAQPEIQQKISPLSSILAHFPMPFFTVDPNLIITHMNKHLEELSGYTAKEAVGRMTCAQLLCTGQCDTHNCLLKQSMRSMMPISGVRRVARNRHGKRIPMVVYASILTDDKGQVVGGFEAVRDISPIVEAEERIALLAEMTQEGVLMLDEDCRILFVNSKMADILGVAKEELIGAHTSEVMSPEQEAIVLDLLYRFNHGNQRRNYSTIVKMSDTSAPAKQRTFDCTLAVSRVGKGIITYVYFRDVTRNIEIENQLRQANNFLSSIIQNSVNGVIVVDGGHNIPMFNHEAERILGYSADEVINHPQIFPRIIYPELETELARRMVDNAYGPPGKVQPFRTSLFNKQGEEIPVSFSLVSIEGEGQQQSAVAIFADLRDQLRMQNELEQARLQVLQADRIASLGRLSAGVAHEINNPLAGIMIYADMLLKEATMHPAWQQDIQEIINQTLRCKEIVTRLLDFSRQSLSHRAMFDVNEVLGQSIDLLSHQVLFQDVDIVSDLDCSLPLLLGDPGQIRQVFTNLIINAADAMEGKGTLHISSRYQPEQEAVVLRFVDSGSGIAEEDVDKIFEPFFTTKAPGKGTGLGLSISYGIIQRHGGAIRVESSPGCGTTFTITLPLLPPEDEKAVMLEENMFCGEQRQPGHLRNGL